MNDLPYAFYESVFWVGCTTRIFAISYLSITAQELSGNIGIVAQQMTPMYRCHLVVVRNNGIVDEKRWNRSLSEVPKHLWIEKDKFVYCVALRIYASDEDRVRSEIIDRIAFPNAVYSLALKTATVSKAWIDWACKCERLTRLRICKKLDEEAIVLCKKLIEIGRLTELRIENGAFSEGVMEMAKLSLTQPQFQSLHLMDDGHLNDHLKELLAFWSQNKETLRGKDLFFKSTKNVWFLRKNLKRCAREEFDPIGRHHLYFPRSLFGRPSHPYKLKYGRDDGDGHCAYMLFACEPRKPNVDEMSYFAETPAIGILFM